MMMVIMMMIMIVVVMLMIHAVFSFLVILTRVHFVRYTREVKSQYFQRVAFNTKNQGILPQFFLQDSGLTISFSDEIALKIGENPNN